MKANELRIGNFVSTRFENKSFVVTGIRNQHTKDGDFELIFLSNGKSFLPVHIEPIPLTEEWLLKFGFKQKKLDSYFDTTKWSDGKNIITVNTDLFVTMESTFHKRAEYVHTLQNLYFALTGEELTIKPA